MTNEVFTNIRVGDALAVRHKSSGRIYMPRSSPERLYWDDVQGYLDSLNQDRYAGFNTWRLPTIKELLEPVDYEQFSPAINAAHFAGVKPNFHWSSSVYAHIRDFQWGVYFYGGGTDVVHRQGIYGYVLAVCDGVPASPGQ